MSQVSLIPGGLVRVYHVVCSSLRGGSAGGSPPNPFPTQRLQLEVPLMETHMHDGMENSVSKCLWPGRDSFPVGYHGDKPLFLLFVLLSGSFVWWFPFAKGCSPFRAFI